MKNTMSGKMASGGGGEKVNGNHWLGAVPVSVQKPPQQNGNSTREDVRNGFEEWGGYMGAKKAKLDQQINHKNGIEEAGALGSGIFNGISIYINGYTVPPEPELRKIFVEHGGTFHPYRNSTTKFVIATNLSLPSKNLYAAITVKPEWITDSIVAGVQLNHRDYMLYNLNEENNQRTLTQMMGMGQPSNQPVVNISKSTLNSATTSVSNINSANENGILPLSDVDESKADSNGHINGFQRIPVGVSGKKVKTATEDGFLEDFFQNSRLHLISDQKKEMQNKIGNMRKSMDTHNFEFLDEFIRLHEHDNNTSNPDNLIEPVTLMHIDLDCFFVSVGLLSRPHLRGKPIVVTHSTGKTDNSKSDIASASYEARKFGVANGMWVSEAKKLCPDLVVVPYDFDEYRRVSNTFFETVAKVTLDIEPMSVDEMVIDASSVLQKVPTASPSDLAEFIRSKIFVAVHCTASVGIGCNKLIAKLATKKAKPNGIYHLTLEESEYFIKQLPIRELPGIGISAETKLHDLFKVQTCQDLLMVSLQSLKNEFGVKTAEKMIQSCKGIDSCELKYGFDRPKSISVDVNYGIRFTHQDQVIEFLLKLSKELSTRAVQAQAKGANLSLKILSRRKGAGEPKKHGGHGIVDSTTRSNRLLQPSNDWNDFFRLISRIIRLLPIPASDYRGVGLSLTDLTFEFDKSVNQNKQRTFFDLANSRGQKMLEYAKKSAIKRDAVALNDQQTKQSNNNNNMNHDSLSPPIPKRRKLEFEEPSTNKTPPESVTTTNTPSENASTTENIDLNVLRELPEEMQREVAEQYGIDFSSLSSKQSETTDLVGQEQERNNSEIGNNPYSEIEQIDPAYLCALPETIRNEVLLQFQEAQGKKINGLSVDINSVVAVLEQPCSSRQALERDNILKANIPNNISKDCDDRLKDPSPDIQNKLLCDEKMHDDIVYMTPSKRSQNVTPNSTSQEQRHNRRSGLLFRTTPLSSRRRLDFTGGQSDSTNTFDMDKFWEDRSYIPLKPSKLEQKLMSLPTLHGAKDVEDIRNLIREMIATDTVPDDEDILILGKYFYDIIKRGYLKQGQTLLKFLCRKYESLPEESEWRGMIEEIVTVAQAQCIELYQCELDLELN